MKSRGIVLVGGIGSGVALTAVLGRILRSRVTDAAQSDRFIRISGVGTDDAGEWVEFPSGSFAAHPGQMYLTTPSGGGKLTLGPPTTDPDAVRRRVLAGDATELRREGRGRLSGYLDQTPADLGLQYQDVETNGRRLWKVPGMRPAHESTWVIHVHGLGSRRSQTLRGVMTFSSLGFTSLVPTYRTSLDGGVTTPPRSHLGLSEWEDIARAQAYAVASGAEKIIYVGWSLGASIALQTMRRAPRSEVAGALLISPALDWRAIVLSAVEAMQAPRWLGRWALSGFNLIRAAGEPRVAWGSLPGTSPTTDPRVPLMIFHGTCDRSVPIQLSRDVVARNPGSAQLVEFPEAGHTLEWNSDPDAWDQHIHTWCKSLHLLNDTPANLEAA